jgi:hypothetical protein
MMRPSDVLVRESQIEDILVQHPDVLSRVLGLPEQAVILARQMQVPAGRLDILAAAGRALLVAELKVAPCQERFITQVCEYREAVRRLQEAGKLMAGDVHAYLLVPWISDRLRRDCEAQGVTAVEYDPSEILAAFYERFGGRAAFLSLRPPDHGLWGLRLLNRLLYRLLDRRLDAAQLSAECRLSPGTVRSYMRLAAELGLSESDRAGYVLTRTGASYVRAADPQAPYANLSEAQCLVLQEHIVSDPFASRVIFGIYTLVEAVFQLSRNTYPVPLHLASFHFRCAAGKYFDWKTEKAEYVGVRSYTNYACELGLVAKVGDALYMTPGGITFVLLLNLHKSIRFLHALGIPEREPPAQRRQVSQPTDVEVGMFQQARVPASP